MRARVSSTRKHACARTDSCSPPINPFSIARATDSTRTTATRVRLCRFRTEEHGDIADSGDQVAAAFLSQLRSEFLLLIFEVELQLDQFMVFQDVIQAARNCGLAASRSCTFGFHLAWSLRVPLIFTENRAEGAQFSIGLGACWVLARIRVLPRQRLQILVRPSFSKNWTPIQTRTLIRHFPSDKLPTYSALYIWKDIIMNKKSIFERHNRMAALPFCPSVWINWRLWLKPVQSSSLNQSKANGDDF